MPHRVLISARSGLLYLQIGGRGAIKKEKYIAELTKLLGFMSPWDRRAEIRRYERMFDITPDEDALIEELGTPTKVAVELARDYVATPPPETLDLQLPWEKQEPAAEAETRQTEEKVSEIAAEVEAVLTPPPSPPPQPPKRELRGGGVFAFVLLTLAIGLPVFAVLLCIGVPILAGGIGCIGIAVEQVLHSVGRFNLFSDLLLVWGSGLVIAGVGLLLAWIGIWISLSLCRLWIEKVLAPLAIALCVKKEVAQNG